MTEHLQTISGIAASALIAGIWQGAMLTTMIWLCLKIAPRTTAGVRFSIWAAVFAAIGALPLLSIAFASTDGGSSAATHASSPVFLLDTKWAFGIAAIWAMFAVGRLLDLARNAFKVRALWKLSAPVELTSSLQAILTQPGLRGAMLCTSPAVDQPCVIGFFSPRILIPAWLLESATPSELQQIVLHESAHLRRFDDWTNLAQKLALACFPLNPAMVWIERRLCAEREIACDESVVRATRAPRDYASCLTHLAERRLAHRTLALSGGLSLGAWERRSQLASRVESILLGKANLGPIRARAMAFSLILATVGSAVKLGSSSQLVSFAATQSDTLLSAQNPHSTSGPHYQNVVFHPASPSTPLRSDHRAQAKPVGRQAARTTAKTSLRRAQPSRDGVRSLLIVTRWQSVSGQQITVIDQVVRISALSAARSQGGWFVVQL